MIVSDACTINVSLVFALALASVVNYAHKWHHSLVRHLLMTLVIIYDCNMFIVQATGWTKIIKSDKEKMFYNVNARLPRPRTRQRCCSVDFLQFSSLTRRSSRATRWPSIKTYFLCCCHPLREKLRDTGMGLSQKNVLMWNHTIGDWN